MFVTPKPPCGCVVYPTFGLDAAYEGNIVMGYHMEPCDQHTELDLIPYIEAMARADHRRTTGKEFQMPSCRWWFRACPGENCQTAKRFIRRIREEASA